MGNRESKTLLTLALYTDNDYDKIIEILREKTYFFSDEEIEYNAKKWEGKYITCWDEDYPPLYKELLLAHQKVPLVIFK